MLCCTHPTTHHMGKKRSVLASAREIPKLMSSRTLSINCEGSVGIRNSATRRKVFLFKRGWWRWFDRGGSHSARLCAVGVVRTENLRLRVHHEGYTYTVAESQHISCHLCALVRSSRSVTSKMLVGRRQAGKVFAERSSREI